MPKYTTNDPYWISKPHFILPDKTYANWHISHWSISKGEAKVGHVLEGVEIWILAISVIVACGILFTGMIAQSSDPVSLRKPPYLPKAPGWGGWRVSIGYYNYIDLLIVGLLMMLYAFPLLLQAVAQFLPEKKAADNSELNLGMLLTHIIFQFTITGFIIWAASRHKRISEWLGMRWRLWPLVFLIAPIGVVATWIFAGGLEVLKINDWLRDQMGVADQQAVVKAFSEMDSPLMLGLLSFMAVIVAPITEEIIFRGYLYPVAKHYSGRLPALLFSSIVFAAIHQSTIAFLPLLFLALVLAISYELTGSILAPISIHILFNSMTVMAQVAQKLEWITVPE